MEMQTLVSSQLISFLKLINGGHARNAKNYQLAVNHLERYLGTTQIMFSTLTSVVSEKMDR